MSHRSDIDQVYQKLKFRADMLYEFVILYHNFINAKHTYDSEHCNMIEMHTLIYIDDYPGITATELAKRWHKSKSSISHVVKHLMESGYVEKQYTDNNEKTAHLFATEKGKRASSIHKAYDVADIIQTSTHLEERCSKEDLDAFYRIIAEYIQLLKAEDWAVPTANNPPERYGRRSAPYRSGGSEIPYDCADSCGSAYASSPMS